MLMTSIVVIVVVVLVISVVTNFMMREENKRMKKSATEALDHIMGLEGDKRNFQTVVEEQSEIIVNLKNENSRRKQIEKDKFNAMQTELQDEISRLKNENKALEQVNASVQKEKSELEGSLNIALDKLQRIQTLHPEINVETEVEKMIEDEYKHEASKADGKLQKYFEVSAGKDNIEFFEEALQSATSITPEVKKYLKSDISEFQKRKDESIRMKAEYEKEQKELADKAKVNAAYAEMKKVYDCVSEVVKHTDYDQMHNAYSLYEALSSEQMQYFPDDFLRSFKNHYRRVSDAHTAYTRAEDAMDNAKRTVYGISHADEDDMKKVEKAYRYYSDLSSVEQVYFDKSIVDMLVRLRREAEEDHERQEHRRREEKKRREEEERRRREEEERRRRERRKREEEERRRRASSMVNHSHSSGGSFGGSSFGHGGHSTGGGAGKHF